MPTEQQRLEYLQALGIDAWILQRKPRKSELDFSEVAVTADSSMPDWELLRSAVASCTGCLLHEHRTQTVFGVGNLNADWMIIGEAPGAEEDRRGEPFVGRAGKLLDEMHNKLNLELPEVSLSLFSICKNSYHVVMPMKI